MRIEELFLKQNYHNFHWIKKYIKNDILMLWIDRFRKFEFQYNFIVKYRSNYEEGLKVSKVDQVTFFFIAYVPFCPFSSYFQFVGRRMRVVRPCSWSALWPGNLVRFEPRVCGQKTVLKKSTRRLVSIWSRLLDAISAAAAKTNKNVREMKVQIPLLPPLHVDFCSFMTKRLRKSNQVSETNPMTLTGGELRKEKNVIKQ